MNQEQLDFQYAGFWIRVFAAIFDTIILGLLLAPITILFFGFEYYTATDRPFVEGWLDVVINWLLPIVVVIGCWVLFAATPGKLILNLQVLDATTGEKITPLKGLIRYIGYFIAMIPLFIGVIWVAFDSRKQGWHDKIAGTVVVYK